ncbi:MAG TPA: serine hydrolase domain-containing protein [Puia sp.]|jgi:D-alanyl-D-alanine carboxypeptidase|nr:serine hydrolase domain-containing protein [Puia sp.]
MKKVILLVLSTLCFVLVIFAQPKNSIPDCVPDVVINKNFSKASVIDSILRKYTAEGLPGVSIAVFTEQEGWWAGAGGYSKLETKTLMTNCNIQYLQSVSKTYMAVVIMKLYEEGKIKLDVPITGYLPLKYSRFIKQADKMTVRMLLNHTSGVPEYGNNPVFVANIILHPTTIFKMEEAISCLADESPMFEPGSRHSYSNTNYLLLAMIADVITGDHAKYMEENIFKPLSLNHTFYRSNNRYLNYPDLTDSYWDVLNCGRPANITPLQKANVAMLKGDDGIVCTTTDAIKFLKGLVEHKLLRDSTFALMQHWVNDDKGNPIYGLGLVHYEAGGLVGFGHSGGGIGAGCVLIYVPSKKTYLFMATNLGVLIESDLSKKADNMKDEILGALLF